MSMVVQTGFLGNISNFHFIVKFAIPPISMNTFLYHNILFRSVVTRMGIEVSFTDFTNIEKFKNEFKKNTKVCDRYIFT